MWARVLELVLGIWLSISWIIFGYKNIPWLLTHDYICFILIGCFALFSYWTPLRHLHLMNFLMAFWFGFFSYFVRSLGLEVPAQNYMTLAWLLLILSIVPSHSGRPPYQWIKFLFK